MENTISRHLPLRRKVRNPPSAGSDEIRIERIENRVEFVFTGNGFLHHMIRILMGTLLEVGKGIRTPESVTDVLESGDRAKAGALVPAKGLVLEEVFYT